jgi:VanZ family protein
MMAEPPMQSKDQLRASSWSHRILIAAVVGILFLTLYPFRFGFTRHPSGHVFPFLLNGWGKDGGPFDVFLNVLLFVPYGFGLAERFCEQGKSRAATLGATLAAGALLSYTIEFLQFYIPLRDSGWEDVLTNSAGSVAGFLLFELCGTVALRLLSETERVRGAWLTLWRSVLILLLYFGLWLAISVPLQKEIQLSNWQPDSLLVVGHTGSGQVGSGWKGEVYRLELWDHALPDQIARTLTSQEPADAVGPASLAAYDFSGSPPFQDQRHFLPELSWTPQTPVLTDAGAAVLDGKAWLTSRVPVSAWVNDVQAAQQFALLVRCEPADVTGIDGRIVSISQTSGPLDLELRQEDTNLVFWFRTPLSVKRSRLAWDIPNIFAPKQPRDILLSFDGSDLSLYVDGKKERRSYRLGPGAGLAQLFRRVKPAELEGYRYIFYALVFFPAGCLLGLASRNLAARPIAQSLLMVLGILLPSVLFEINLVHVSGHGISSGNVALSVLLALGGSLWVNADGGALDRLLGSRFPGPAL